VRWDLHTHYYSEAFFRLIEQVSSSAPTTLVAGSDYSHLLGSIDRAVSSIQSVDLSKADKERISSGTAREILCNVA
jgi:hypothetical protein